ncbi:hypothetical protein PR048_019130 [Dryococelus australis]|uniref:Uncharacterized protein n=1 Tax=Dryococelus australis TaxID=614101 RepID=A0ABQ9H2M4_9NEOP|nr:hypothetical protein PR048_019130 [Dryococelus australis]
MWACQFCDSPREALRTRALCLIDYERFSLLAKLLAGEEATSRRLADDVPKCPRKLIPFCLRAQRDLPEAFPRRRQPGSRVFAGFRRMFTRVASREQFVYGPMFIRIFVIIPLSSARTRRLNFLSRDTRCKPKMAFISPPQKMLAAWSEYSLPIRSTWVRFPARSLPEFRMWESSWAKPLVGGLSRRSPGTPPPPPLHFASAPYTIHITLISSQDLDVDSRPNLSTPLNDGRETLDLSSPWCSLARDAYSDKDTSLPAG